MAIVGLELRVHWQGTKGMFLGIFPPGEDISETLALKTKQQQQTTTETYNP